MANNSRWNFDKWSLNYDNSVLNGDWIHSSYTSVINNIINLIVDYSNFRNLDLLDIGAGTGTLISMLHPYNKIICHAMEPSKGMRDKLRHKCPNTIVIDGELPILPSIDNKFDIIVSSYVIHHIPHDQSSSMIDNICRYGKYKSMIILADVMFETKDEFDRHILDLTSKHMLERIEDLRDEYFQYINILKEGLIKNGFCNLAMHRYDYYTHHIVAKRE